MSYRPELPWPERYERNVRIVELFAEGKSCSEIARVVGLNYSAVANVLRGAGVDPAPFKAESAPSLHRKDERNAQIIKARAEGASLAELGRRYAVSRQRIFSIVREAAPEVPDASRYRATQSSGKGRRWSVTSLEAARLADIIILDVFDVMLETEAAELHYHPETNARFDAAEYDAVRAVVQQRRNVLERRVLRRTSATGGGGQ